jgi:hypothetical protein
MNREICQCGRKDCYNRPKPAVKAPVKAPFKAPVNCDCDCVVDDILAKKIEKIWKAAYPGATLLPVIGLPSNANGVGTLTHAAGGPLLKINGLTSKSPLSNNALYSFECADGVYMNLYEIMIPDIPGKNGEKSTVEYYTSLLQKYGLSVAGNHYHWYGQFMMPEATLVAAIHHQSTSNDITPEEFSRRTILALDKTSKLIEERMGNY